MLITKKLLSVFLCAVLLLLTACSTHGEKYAENELYTIYAKDGQYSLVMKQTPGLSGFEDGSVVRTDPKFSSLAEMREAILTGSFSDMELFAIQRFSKNDAGNIIICDINNLYEPVLPKNITIGEVVWHGDSYGFLFDTSRSTVFPSDTSQDSNYGRYCSMKYVSEESFNRSLKNFTEFTQNDNIEILSQQKDDITGGTIYTYRTYLGYTFQDILYTISDENKTIYVHEKRDSDSVTIWGIESGIYFIVNIAPKGRLDPNWAFSFGLVPYVEDAEKA